jgi:hypothetical protein
LVGGKNIRLGVQKHERIEKVTGSQDDGLVGGKNKDGLCSCVAQPLLHLLVADEACLLEDRAASGENYEVGDTADVKTCSQFRMRFGVDLEDNCFSGHILGGTRDLGRSRAARSAPGCPKVDKHGNGCVVDHFVEENRIGRQWFGDRGKRSLARAASTCAG